MAADSPPPETTSGRPLRRDAQRNRDALLDAARRAFAQEGLEASLEKVAKDAGLANGTLYRHFPTRLDLVQAALADKLHLWLEATGKAATMDDTWEGLCHFLETTCELQAGDRGFSGLTGIRLPEDTALASIRTRVHELAIRIVERAQEQGTVRDDVTPEDVAFVLWANARVAEATREVAPDVWRRYLYLMLDAYRAGRAHPLPVPALTPEQLYTAMKRPVELALRPL